METVNIQINGMPLSVPKGISILEAARFAGIEIPTLCYLKEINSLYDNTVFSMLYMNDYDENCEKTESDVIVCGGYDKKMKIVCQECDLNKKAVTYGEYERPEALYKMRVLSNNQKYKFAAINFGCSANLYFWGIKNIDNK